jgi:hypothetical protein
VGFRSSCPPGFSRLVGFIRPVRQTLVVI